MIIEELTEAHEICEDLSGRISHRAFRSESAPLARSGEEFTSFLSRIGKRFRNFKHAMADLYRSELPEREQLLSDCRKLTTYHRRVELAQELLDELGEHLPGSCDTSDTATLQQVLMAANSLSDALSKLKSTAPLTQGSQNRLDGLVIKTTAAEVLAKAGVFPELPTDLADKPLSTVDSAIAQRVQTIEDGLSFLQAADTCYDGDTPKLDVVLQDIQLTAQVNACVAPLEARAAEFREALPDAFDQTCEQAWSALGKSVRRAQEVVTGFRLSSETIDRICQTDLAQLEQTAPTIESLLTNYETLAALLKDNREALDDVVDSPFEDLSCEQIEEQVKIERQKFARFSDALQHYVSVLQPDSDIPLEDIDTAGRQLLELQQLKQSRLRHSAAAEQIGLQRPASDDGNRAEWLKSACDAGRLSPLAKAAATDEAVRLTSQSAHRCLNELGHMLKPFAYFEELFSGGRTLQNGVLLREAQLNEIADWAAQLKTHITEVDVYIRFKRWRDDLENCGLEGAVEELISRRYTPEAASTLVMLRVYQMLGDHLISSDPVLGRFDLDDHERLRQQFEELDRFEISAAAVSIRECQLTRADRPRSGFDAANSELGILKKEVSKKRKHMPLRRLFSAIAEILLRLKPCIMMSPLSVSTFLNDDRLRFDLVVFDEASQVFPWDAMGAIYRGRQLIVAGDEKQLPPTNFFQRADAESEDEEDISDYESILSVCKANNMPSIRLRWHYRSRREALIAFSNRHFYDGDLVTFPSAHDASNDGVRFELVDEGRWLDRKSIPEAKRVVDLIIEYRQSHSEKSLGVIAFSQSQRTAIDDELYDRRRNDAKLDKLFSRSANEPLFIKNLESVQGDERDVILLSVGYGRNADNKIPARFGPVNASGGERRLNVAVTRAREQMIVVSSIRAADLDLSGSKSEGAQLMKAYLHYAETGTDSLGALSSSTGDQTESPFEADVAAALIRRGFEPIPQIGCGGFRIDLAIKHSDLPGQYCLGIECDGATYHSSKTARDRDRIRQTMLESLGWKIVRVWSTDWVRDPDKQLDRIEDAYRAAIETREELVPHHVGSSDLDSHLQPRIQENNGHSTSAAFDRIEDVPESTIEQILNEILLRTGPCPEEDVIKLASRQLGFRRVGVKIRQRLATTIERQLARGTLKERLGRISLCS